MKMEMQVKVLTLNCWGIVGISKDRKERFAEIASILAGGDFDFVFLQEVWDQGDFDLIKEKTSSVLPYSKYFYSGIVGSGCCIFSKGEIVDTGFLKYSLNGYIHKVQHGDWFGGKGLGLCKVHYRGLAINLYNTHFHAHYDQINDEYLPHRLIQAWECSQYINLTSPGADLSIIAGDLNAMPQDISYQLVRSNSSLYDSYEERENKQVELSCNGASCGHPRNSYTTKAELKAFPEGQRIDHIFYTFPNGTNVRCLELTTPYDKVTNKTFSVSDHEAVVSHLLIKKSQEELGYQSEASSRLDTLRSAKLIVQAALQHLRFSKVFYLLLSILTFVLMVVSSAVFIPYPLSVILIPLRVVLTLLLTFGIFMCFICNPAEKKIFTGTMQSMELIVSNVAHKKTMK